MPGKSFSLCFNLKMTFLRISSLTGKILHPDSFSSFSTVGRFSIFSPSWTTAINLTQPNRKSKLPVHLYFFRRFFFILPVCRSCRKWKRGGGGGGGAGGGAGGRVGGG